MYASLGMSRIAVKPADVDMRHMYEACSISTNVHLPRGGHFSLSAATGGIAGTPLWACSTNK